MNISSHWSSCGTDAHVIRRLMSYVSLRVRCKQYEYFIQLIRPGKNDSILDVGVSPNMRLHDTNFFEKQYPYKKRVTIASIENCQHIEKQFGLKRFVRIREDGKIPVADHSFDCVVSWATLEHTGNRISQYTFLQELCRVGKHVFVTTPDRLAIYEPHTTFFFLHWLPLPLFRRVARFLGKPFWAQEKNLNPLTFHEAQELAGRLGLTVMQWKICGVLPSHLIFYRQV